MTAADVFAFSAEQRSAAPRRDGGADRGRRGGAGGAHDRQAPVERGGLVRVSARARRRGVTSNPVPRGLASRRPGRRGRGGVPLVRTPRTLPRVLSPAEVDALLGALRTRRDRAMVLAMLLGGLRRCEVLGLRLGDVNVGERRVFITAGKGGRERIVPVSSRFFAALGEYLELERPAERGHGGVLRGAQGPPPRLGRCRRPGWMRCSPARGHARGCRSARAISCGTRA